GDEVGPAGQPHGDRVPPIALPDVQRGHGRFHGGAAEASLGLPGPRRLRRGPSNRPPPASQARARPRPPKSSPHHSGGRCALKIRYGVFRSRLEIWQSKAWGAQAEDEFFYVVESLRAFSPRATRPWTPARNWARRG